MLPKTLRMRRFAVPSIALVAMWIFCPRLYKIGVSLKLRAPDPRGGHASRRKKPLIQLPFPAVDGQLPASCEPTASNSIDPVRDAESFPESCGEERDIGSVLESVKRLT